MRYINRIQRVKISLLETRIKKPLELESVVLLHAHSGDLEVPVWFVDFNELAIDTHVKTTFKNRYVRGIFSSVQKIKLRNSRPVYISAIGYESKKETRLVLANEMLTVESPNWDENCAAQQTVISPTMESSVLIVFKVAVLQLIK